jgi:hypothetical protein
LPFSSATLKQYHDLEIKVKTFFEGATLETIVIANNPGQNLELQES